MWWKNIIRRLIADYNHQQNEDKRNSPRFEARMLVSFESELSAHETKGNVGIGGFFFQLHLAPEAGDEVELLVDLEGQLKWIQATGEVLEVVTLENGFGIRGKFTSIAFDEERQLARWLDHESGVVKICDKKIGKAQARSELSSASVGF